MTSHDLPVSEVTRLLAEDQSRFRTQVLVNLLTDLFTHPATPQPEREAALRLADYLSEKLRD